MSKDRFPYFPARARHFNSPLAEERHRFLARLVQQGYVRLSVENAARYLLTITKSLRLDKRPGVLIGHAEIESHASRWAHRQNRPKWSRQKNPDIVFGTPKGVPYVQDATFFGYRSGPTSLRGASRPSEYRRAYHPGI